MAALVTEQIKAEILEIFPNANFDKYKYGVPKKHPLYEKFRSFARKPDKALYEKTPERAARRRDLQKASYARNPESYLARSRKYLTQPDVAEKRRKYLWIILYFRLWLVCYI